MFNEILESNIFVCNTVITVNDDQTTAVLRATITTNTTRFYGLVTPSATTNRVTK